jgi:hypothetical protein
MASNPSGGTMSNSPRHILSLSGGKDSTALAIYMRDRVADMEYVFCDTKKELPETYEYLDRIEAYLGKPIVRLCDDRGFDHWLKVYNNYLPSSRMRWCTKVLKIKPFEKYVGDDEVMMYVGIRADEDRWPTFRPSPTSIPSIRSRTTASIWTACIASWRKAGSDFRTTTTGARDPAAYFCFFQRRNEWVGLLENHPDKYDEAKQYEKIDPETGERYTWCQRESLEELQQHVPRDTNCSARSPYLRHVSWKSVADRGAMRRSWFSWAAIRRILTVAKKWSHKLWNCIRSWLGGLDARRSRCPKMTTCCASDTTWCFVRRSSCTWMIRVWSVWHRKWLD